MQLKTNKLLRANRNYSKQILESAPYIYHKFEENSGTSFLDISGNNNTGTINGSITLNQNSLLPMLSSRKSALFNNGSVVYSNSFAGTSTFAIELLFKTTASYGGLVFCSNLSASENTGNWDKCLFISNGHIGLFTYPGGNRVIKTPLTYNDNKSHIITATVGLRGTELWVDGLLAVSSSETSSQIYNSYWHVGFAKWWDNGDTREAFFNGLIDEFSVCHYQLSQSAIINRHKNAGF